VDAAACHMHATGAQVTSRCRRPHKGRARLIDRCHGYNFVIIGQLTPSYRGRSCRRLVAARDTRRLATRVYDVYERPIEEPRQCCTVRARGVVTQRDPGRTEARQNGSSTLRRRSRSTSLRDSLAGRSIPAASWCRASGPVLVPARVIKISAFPGAIDPPTRKPGSPRIIRVARLTRGLQAAGAYRSRQRSDPPAWSVLPPAQTRDSPPTYWVAAPCCTHRASRARSSSVMCVRLLSGMARVATTCT
jgi:hypothetical protein